MLGLLHSAVAGHEGGHLLDALQWERRLAQRPYGDGHELHGIVVRRHTVGAERSAALAAVDDRPLAALAYPDRHRLHNTAAVRGPVAGLDVYVQAGKAVRTVVAVVAAGVLRRAEPAADLAGKGILAGVRLVVAFFKGLAFVFAVHGVSSGRKIMRNPSGGAACVGFAGPPGQATRSGDRVMCFKKFSFKF